LSKLVELKNARNVDFENATITLFKDNFTDDVVIPLLKQVGLGNIRLYLIEKSKQYIFFGANAFVTKPHIIGTNNPLVMKKVYGLLHSKFDQFVDHASRSQIIVYYYRVNRSRVVINDNELLPILKDLGVYCTTFDDLSYLDAIRLMRKTKIFIGIHGGGLTNMVFQKPGSKIIEIKNNNVNPHSHCYWHLARSLNFDYTLFIAETVGDSEIIEGNGCNVSVNINNLLECINLVDKN
jgi:capsular polysaccharide biosynthesis protein